MTPSTLLQHDCCCCAIASTSGCHRTDLHRAFGCTFRKLNAAFGVQRRQQRAAQSSLRQRFASARRNPASAEYDHLGGSPEVRCCSQCRQPSLSQTGEQFAGRSFACIDRFERAPSWHALQTAGSSRNVTMSCWSAENSDRNEECATATTSTSNRGRCSTRPK